MNMARTKDVSSPAGVCWRWKRTATVFLTVHVGSFLVQVCTFYFQYSDALSTLDWIKKEVPDLGKTASVLAISLSQAFQLAQDSQQPLPEETEKKEGETNGNGNAEASAAETKESSEKAAEKPAAATEKSEEKTADETAGDDKVAADGEPAEKAKDEKPSDDLDADLPLAFQFRPELRQVRLCSLSYAAVVPFSTFPFFFFFFF